ncbi:MAG: TRAP transporter substrate-binding protein [Ruminococcaceae bacterium]|jgi:TRAP-type C4-dicarboxylate transport system substrate-binding protein|nr:TRAP transporter substrate-binding protein [Oscillospiraceae bacterium]
MKKALSLVLALAMILALAACGGNSSSATPSTGTQTTTTAPASSGSTTTTTPAADTNNVANDPKVTLVYAEVNPIDSFIGQVATAFKEKAEELSGGSITIDIQAGGVLGSENDVLDSIMAGSNQIDISRISVFALNSYGVKKTVLCTLPFTFASREHFWKFANSDLAKEFLNEPQEIGLPVRGIFFGEEGFRHFFTRDPISGIEDLKGMKLRVSNDPIMNGLVNGLGASPTVVSFGELYSALNSGVCDGAEQPIGNYKSNSFDEVAPNMILDGHTLGAVQVIVTDSGWNKLTPAQQDVIMQAAAYAQQFNQQLMEGAEQKVLDQLKSEGVNIVEVTDKTPWANAVKDVVSQYTAGELGDLYQQIQAMK